LSWTQSIFKNRYHPRDEEEEEDMDELMYRRHKRKLVDGNE
jgi:hypothetical protein